MDDAAHPFTDEVRGDLPAGFDAVCCGAFAAALPPGEAAAVSASSFLEQALDDLRQEEVAGLDPRDAAELLAALWRRAATGVRTDADVELAPGVRHDGGDLGLDVLTIRQPDRPFLVDSVMAELADAGVEPRALAHPVVQIRRDAFGARVVADGVEERESMILVLLAPVGEDRRAKVLEGLRAALADVHAAVDDRDAMLALVAKVEADLAAAGGADREEEIAFLRWLTHDRFLFLGARVYDYPLDAHGAYAAEEPRFSAQTSFGVLRDPTRSVLRRASEPAILARDMATYLRGADTLVVAKSNLRSRVHRRVYTDYVGVKRYDTSGRAVGETRFVGLFTLEAYGEPTREVPLIRRKIERVVARAGAKPSAYTLKRLRHIAETYPRDELFQIDEDQLYAIAQGVLHLYDRPRVRLFTRVDPFDRFVSALLYLPRERYDSQAHARAGEILARAWRGRVSASYPSFSSDPLARIHFILGVTPGDHADPDPRALEAEIAASIRTWRDRFEAEVRNRGGAPGEVFARLQRYGPDAFPLGYQDATDSTETLADVDEIEALAGRGAVRVRAFRDAACNPREFRFKLYRDGETAAPLADVLPILESMGLKALEEEGYTVRRTGAAAAWVHAFSVRDDRGEGLSFDEVRAPFEAAFVAVWCGRAENDGFNRLVLELGVDWREAALVRALARYRQQSGLDPSQTIQEEALRDNPTIARRLIELFHVRFDPALALDLEARGARSTKLFDDIVERLQAVRSLDADRSLRRLAELVRALVRTNFYQHDAGGRLHPYVSFKIASRELADLPAPRPFREIFVSGPIVDGVHLRFGPVARGGLRWSDRRDDFRTEVLGLVKAQQVKNAVIVPVGSKGGFYPKLLPRGGDADSVRAEGVRAYEIFLHGLLDITDNLDAEGRVVHPPQVIDYDGDDPYLVVAADKGTASFSDIANTVARGAGFWLDDAFASGGSAGYDHKAMAITARGAWEAVKRHFREAGKDIQAEPFTMIGVGDMSGDVFGNGALLSRQIRLVAAFDHRHVFLDPDPDPETSWRERRRLFELPRSSWADYDPALISPGGAVIPRSAKSVTLSPQARSLLGVGDAPISTIDLVRAVLRTPAELLYLGGIGTYLKATNETNGDVGDKANDAVRIDAAELAVQVVGEGANLGLTQAARIAYARIGAGGRGGRINTDAIDNSAGVDTSDHEVNIKILLGQAIADGALAADTRETLLASMTDEVAQRVLAHNYAQTLSLSLQQAGGVLELEAQSRFMSDLVAAGRLDRKLEGLPGPQALLDLGAQNLGLTRPELAILTAYGKLELSEAIVASDAPDDPYFETTLSAYFPPALARFEPQMRRHRLRREIVATTLANGVVDWLGPTFAGRLASATGADAGLLVTAFEAARRIFRLDEAWVQVSALDGRVAAALQLELYAEIARATRAHVYGLTRRSRAGITHVQSLIDAYRPAADALAHTDEGLDAAERETADARMRALVEAGAPELLARRITTLRASSPTVEIADAARLYNRPIEVTAQIFHRASRRVGLVTLRDAAAGAWAADAFERAALRGLLTELLDVEVALTGAVLAGAATDLAGLEAVEAAVEAWTGPRLTTLERARRTIAEIETSAGGWSFAKLSLASQALRAAMT